MESHEKTAMDREFIADRYALVQIPSARCGFEGRLYLS